MDTPNHIEGWKKVCDLGRGGFGIVTLWGNEELDEQIAIKKCRWEMPEQIPAKTRERWSNEVAIMKKIDHANIVAFKKLPSALEPLEIKYNPSKLPLLSMEYCTKGNLRHSLSSHPHACGLPELELRYLLRDLLGAVSYLHSLKITHRDLKPENIVLQKSDTRPTQTIYKLIDLGYAKELNSVVASFVGTLHYLAPEIFEQDSYTRSVDYWSLGIVAFEAICGVHPFLPNMPPVARFEYISKKSANDICIYPSRSGEIKYSGEIIKENHISLCLKTHLERWLRIVLRYDAPERGVTGTNKDVFQELQHILDKNIICVFSVYNYEYFYFEIEEGTLLSELQAWIETATRIPVDDQLLLTDNMFHDVNKNPRVLECLDEVNVNTELILFSKGNFVESVEATIPPIIKTLLTDPKKLHTWNTLYPKIAQAVHYILKERQLMRSVKQAFATESSYLENLFKRERTVHESLLTATHKMLIDIESTDAKLRSAMRFAGTEERVKEYRRHLRQGRELIDNVNAATVRHARLQSREQPLMTSSRDIAASLEKLNMDAIYTSALQCLQISNQRAELSPGEIVKCLNCCLKNKILLNSHTAIEQHLRASAKVFREMNRMFKWMGALNQNIVNVTGEICGFQEHIVENLAKFKEERTEALAKFDYSGQAVDELIKENVNLRASVQEVLSRLLATHKAHSDEVQSMGDFTGPST